MFNFTKKLNVNDRINVLKKLYPFYQNHIQLLLLCELLAFISFLISLVPTFLYMLYVNTILSKDEQNFLYPILVGYIVFFLLQTFVLSFQKSLSLKIQHKIELRLKAKIIDVYSNLDINEQKKYDVGDLERRIQDDVIIARDFLVNHILIFFHTLIYIVVLSTILLCMNTLLALFSFIMIPLSFLFAKYMGTKAFKAKEKYRILQGEYNTFLFHSFQDWKEIKANSLECYYGSLYDNYKKILSKEFIKNHKYHCIHYSFISFKDQFITKMNLYFFGGLMIIYRNLNVGVLLSFIEYFNQLYKYVYSLSNSIMNFKNDMPSINNVIELLAVETPVKLDAQGLTNSIHIENVNFKYDDNQPFLLKNINLTIHEKEHVAIVGRNGSGKTTLIKLIIGYLQPISGKILIGSQEPHLIKPSRIYSKIGVILQEPTLFNFSIKENLLLGTQDVSNEMLINACKKVDIFEYINSLPQKFNTFIGENGVKLSGGQKQKLELARILLRNPDIIIFDEATSSLDSESEKILLNTISDLAKEKTFITISHRLSSIVECNKVVLMDHGEIAAIGSHQELYQNNILYHKLFEKEYVYSAQEVNAERVEI